MENIEKQFEIIKKNAVEVIEESELKEKLKRVLKQALPFLQ